MLSLNPTGKFLMNFCYVHLFSDQGEAELFSGRKFVEKLQFQLVKRRVRIMIDKVAIAIFRDQKFDVDEIVDSLTVAKGELWDIALVYIIVRHLASLPPDKDMASSADKVGRVLSQYLDFIGDERMNSWEVLDLKLQLIKLKCEYDLDLALMRFRRSML